MILVPLSFGMIGCSPFVPLQHLPEKAIILKIASSCPKLKIIFDLGSIHMLRLLDCHHTCDLQTSIEMSHVHQHHETHIYVFWFWDQYNVNQLKCQQHCSY